MLGSLRVKERSDHIATGYNGEVLDGMTHQAGALGSQMDSSEPLLSSARRKSSRRVLPLRPPKVKTYGPTAATACRHLQCRNLATSLIRSGVFSRSLNDIGEVLRML